MKTEALAIFVSCALCSRVPALTIVLNYSHDTAADNFFNTHPFAKAALESARDDIQAAILTVPNEVTTDVVQASVGTTSASHSFTFTYRNPATGALIILPGGL